MQSIEFRDGFKAVPDHIAKKLSQFETYQMTYEEALNRMNNSFLTDMLKDVQSRAVREHLARYGTE